VCDDLCQRERRCLDVEAALDDLEVGGLLRYRYEVLVRALVGEVAQAERLTDLPRRKELLELRTTVSGLSRTREARDDGGPLVGCLELGLGCAGPL
jgi:hypothetical protein